MQKDGEVIDLDICVLCTEQSLPGELLCQRCRDDTRKFSEDESEGSGSSLRAVSGETIAIDPTMPGHICYDHSEEDE